MRGWKKSRPGEGAQEKGEQFGYTSTAIGLKGEWFGWCAYDPYWCWAHEHRDNGRREDRGTKVCLSWFTDNALKCPRCKPGAKITQVAYCPVWRESDSAPCLVIVHERTADKMADVTFGRYCRIHCVDRKAGVVIQAAAERKTFRSDLPYRQGPCDIAVSLLTIWGYPELETWLKRPAAPPPPPTPTTPTTSKPKKGNPMYAAAHDLVETALGGDGTTDLALRRLMARAGGAAPSTNGKHHPPAPE